MERRILFLIENVLCKKGGGRGSSSISIIIISLEDAIDHIRHILCAALKPKLILDMRTESQSEEHNEQRQPDV